MKSEFRDFIDFIVHEIKTNNIFNVIGTAVLLSFLFLLVGLLVGVLGFMVLVLPWHENYILGFISDVVFLLPISAVIYIKFFVEDKLEKYN